MGKQTVKKERTCRGCDCTDKRACNGGCAWVETDLCSSCIDQSVAYWAGYQFALDELIELLEPSRAPAIEALCERLRAKAETIQQQVGRVASAWGHARHGQAEESERGASDEPAAFGKGVRTSDTMGAA